MLQRLADLEVAVAAHSDIAKIEKTLNVTPEQKAVGHVVRTALGERMNMCGFQNWQRALSGHCALAVVDLRHAHAEGALTQARLSKWPVSNFWYSPNGMTD